MTIKNINWTIIEEDDIFQAYGETSVACYLVEKIGDADYYDVTIGSNLFTYQFLDKYMLDNAFKLCEMYEDKMMQAIVNREISFEGVG